MTCFLFVNETSKPDRSHTSFAAIFVYVKCNNAKKAKALKLEKETQRKQAALDALARAGLA